MQQQNLLTAFLLVLTFNLDYAYTICMDKLSAENLDRILKLNPEDLTPEEKAFLYARRSYLNNEQMRIFKKVLNEQYELTIKEE